MMVPADVGGCLHGKYDKIGAALVPAGSLALDPAVRFDGVFVDAPRRRVCPAVRRLRCHMTSRAAMHTGGVPIIPHLMTTLR